jgi:hypothetical protein
MGSGTNPSLKDDPVSLDQPPEVKPAFQGEQSSLPLQADAAVPDTRPKYQLPSNLPNALIHLDDDQVVMARTM